MRNPEIDRYVAEAPAYARPILRKLRTLVHRAVRGLDEAMKWGAPAFTKGGILCSIVAFKDHVAVWFPRGALMADPKGVLEPGRKAKTMKAIRLGSLGDLDAGAFEALVREAARLEEEGIRPAKRKRKPLAVPVELAEALEGNARARGVFDGLSPSARREYSEYVAEAKRPETVRRRVEKTVAELEAKLRKRSPRR